MTLEAKKLGLIQWLANVDDANVIKKIEDLQQDDHDWWDTLTSSQRAKVDRAIAAMDNGEGISHEEVMKKYSKIYGQ